MKNLIKIPKTYCLGEDYEHSCHFLSSDEYGYRCRLYKDSDYFGYPIRGILKPHFCKAKQVKIIERLKNEGKKKKAKTCS